MDSGLAKIKIPIFSICSPCPDFKFWMCNILGSDVGTDDRAYLMYALQTMNINSSCVYFYPYFIPLHQITPDDDQPPAMMRCTEEKIRNEGAYLLGR